MWNTLEATILEKDKLLQDVEAKTNLLQEKDNLIQQLQRSIDDLKGSHRKVWCIKLIHVNMVCTDTVCTVWMNNKGYP